MAVTILNNLVNPQVMGDMINAKIEAQLKLTPFAKLDTSLQGVPGNTKTVPKWGYIGDATNINENSQIDYTAMSTSTETFTIGKAGKGVSITTEAINSGLGNPVGQAETQLAKAIAGKVEKDVLDACLSATMVYDGTSGVIGYNGIVEANGKFEDEEDGIEKVMFIHPNQETQLLKDTNFISADKYAPGVAVNGAIGKIAGCWIKKSLRVPKCDAVSKVNGVYTIKIEGTVVDTDKITIDGEEFELTASDNTPAKAVTSLKAKTYANYTATGSGDTLTLTEKDASAGHGKPSVSTTGAETFVVAVTTQGVAPEVAMFKCPIIKMEADSSETEYTEDELPAISIFLKKDTTVNSFYNQDYDRHEITAYRYYGVAKTNDAKLVLAKFKQNA